MSTRLLMQTTMGDIEIELFADEAPVTVENFLAYVDDGYYAGTVFHRVIPGFVIQGGGMTEDLARKQNGRPPIVNEAENGLQNLRGTLSMARTADPDSATSQFFVNLKDNAALDPGGSSAGYAVFGKVAEGMDVVDAVAAVETDSYAGHDDVPVEPVTITGMQRK